MKVSYHSVHQPKCSVCQKHCKTLESVREHLQGPRANLKCAETFDIVGCNLCLAVFGSIDALELHKASCSFTPAPIPENIPQMLSPPVTNDTFSTPKLVAMDCEMVGGGSDGTLNLCASVCLINENEDVIFHSYVQPTIPITDYRTEITGIIEEHMAIAQPLNTVRERILEILYNGEESIWKQRTHGGKACLLIGHSLHYDLYSLNMNYEEHLIRDTAEYIPLKKANSLRHSLKYLTKTYLGYDIQLGVHSLYENCVAVMRLYKKIRSQEHEIKGKSMNCDSEMTSYSRKRNLFDMERPSDLLKKSPDELLMMSTSEYKCWCLDTKRSAN